MPDLLVPLYDLPGPVEVDGIWVGRPPAHLAHRVAGYVGDTFGEGWRSECLSALRAVPPTVLVAVEERTGGVKGFCCWDATALGFLGPVGVSPEARGNGIGKTLVLRCLSMMRDQGYGYAVIGAAGPVGFFQSFCDARPIDGSEPGIYRCPIDGSSRQD